MAELVTIRPKTGSKKFTAIRGTVSQFSRVDEGGKETDRRTGDYKRERFPNSRQMFRPMWSATRRKWLLKGHDKNNKELNELAAACKFKYAKDHPKAGYYIEEADLYDYADPFFTHKNLKMISFEGEIVLDKDRPIDQIILLGLQSNTQFSTGGENINPMMSQRVRYIITDKNIDTKMKKEARSKEIKVTKLYEALSDDKRLKIAMALGIIRNPDVDREIIDEALWEYATTSNKKATGNMTKQDYFIHMCETDNNEINTRHLISRAKNGGILRKHKDTGYTLFGNSVANTEKQLFDYLSNPDNQEVVIRIEQALEKG